jgi:hypothetical protein
MSAFYAMRYVGQTGLGMAAIYIGHGIVLGFDGADGRYEGTYREVDDHFLAKVGLTFNQPWPLITGEVAKPGVAMVVEIDWPLDFADGAPRQVFLAGLPVTVIMQKVGDIPE